MNSAQKRTEREFLHDLSSPAGALQLHLEYLKEISKSEKLDLEKVREKLEKAVFLAQKISEIITFRREEIKEEA
jgi:hypothetical protein